MTTTRRAGVLIHPSSLPGPFGVGDLGPGSRELLAWLDAAELRIWQVLPLTPVDDEGCPYASPSAFANEALLLSIDDLCDAGWLRSAEKPYVDGSTDRVDWRALRRQKVPALALAADRVRASVDLSAYARTEPKIASWALYRAISEERKAAWWHWPEAIRWRDPAALSAERDRLAARVERELALQWLFEAQWSQLRTDADARGIELWGDVPIFVGRNCCDVWEQPALWRLDDQGQPTVQSGVPPDAFSPDGQLWGHPLYDEPVHAAEGYAWWVARMRRALKATHRVRIDHFRGFEGVWEVPIDARDARGGHWVPGAGRPLLDALKAAFPSMPFLAEDLGVITPAVAALRDAQGLPGMVILQFAFNGDPLAPVRDTHPYLPHMHQRNQVCYTGTHDNDTALGWFRGADDGTREHLRRYLGVPDTAMPWALVRAAWLSTCDTAIVPMTDLLGLGSEARMNVPGIAAGNWSWRLTSDALVLGLADRVAEDVRLAGRATTSPVRR